MDKRSRGVAREKMDFFYEGMGKGYRRRNRSKRKQSRRKKFRRELDKRMKKARTIPFLERKSNYRVTVGLFGKTRYCETLKEALAKVKGKKNYTISKLNQKTNRFRKVVKRGWR